MYIYLNERKNVMKNIIKILSTLIFAFLYYYFLLPPINPSSIAFWIFIIFIIGFYLLVSVLTLSINKLETIINKRKVYDKKQAQKRLLFYSINFATFPSKSAMYT